jgi:Fe-Mn family superoxide dismutase
MHLPIDRRAFLIASAASAAALPRLAAASSPVSAIEPQAIGTSTYLLAPLPYAYDAIEPAIDAETMRIHHDKHHQAYVDNLNAAVRKLPEGFEIPDRIEDLIAKLDTVPESVRTAIRNNGGGHANHDLFWAILAPAGQTGEPSPELAAAIERDFGGLEKLKEAMNAAGASRFGSGWSWLVVLPDGTLAVTSTPNQDSPLMGKAFVDVPGTPILGIDVWEHAYYLKYRNKRGDYLKAIWTVIRWSEVSRRYAAATAR